MNDEISDFWSNASEDDWRSHVAQSVDMGRDLTSDSDRTFYEGVRALSGIYQSLDQDRNDAEPEDLHSEHAMDYYFWGLQRSSVVIDSIVGSACVVLMRWMELVKRIAIGDLMLLEEQFPHVRETKREEEKRWKRHDIELMSNFGTKVEGKAITGAEAVWQMGNCFKHTNGGFGVNPPKLSLRTEETVKKLGFSSGILEIAVNEREEELRELALEKVRYTLDADSIERMALQLGCGAETGLMPLYDHVESWQKAIDARLAKDAKALRL